MAINRWIKVSMGIFEDEKMLLIDNRDDKDSIEIIWFKMLTFAGKQNNGGVFSMKNGKPYSVEDLATIFHRNVKIVQTAIEVFEGYGMIEIVDGVISIPNWNKYQSLDAYNKKLEYDREYQSKKRAMKKEETKKPAPKKKDAVFNDAEALFERVWALYPNKKGKADVSLTQKKKLLKEGFDRLSRCIERYSAENKDTDKKYWKHGSTFFNGGYVDYLDENYETNNKPVVQVQKTEKDEPALDYWSNLEGELIQ